MDLDNNLDNDKTISGIFLTKPQKHESLTDSLSNMEPRDASASKNIKHFAET